MMNALVVYRSCYGATRRYAEWISTMLSANLCEEKYLREEMLRSSDVIIFGSGIYAEKVAAAAMIARYAQQLAGKTVALFAVGLADPEDETVRARVENALKKQLGDQFARVEKFYFRGALDTSRLKIAHKLELRMLQAMLKRKKERTAEEDGLLSALEQPVQFMKKEAIAPLLAFCRAHDA